MGRGKYKALLRHFETHFLVDPFDAPCKFRHRRVVEEEPLHSRRLVLQLFFRLGVALRWVVIVGVDRGFGVLADRRQSARRNGTLHLVEGSAADSHGTNSQVSLVVD